MSLDQLLPEPAVRELFAIWPDQPAVYERHPTALDGMASADALYEWIETGCVPATEIAVVKAPNPSLNPKAFMTDYGRTDPDRLKRLHEQGHTIRLGNLQRVIPGMARISQGIQEETGYSNYIHAFLTPPGEQGLRHHWDQQMAVIVQMAGIKRWQMWAPVVEAPMRAHGESWRVWKPEYLEQWQTTEPDLDIELTPGQALLLPRGWVHNPFTPPGGETSVHLTFAIRERTRYWLAEHLLAGALRGPEFRQTLLPSTVLGEGMVEAADDVRERLVAYLHGLDPKTVAATARRTALRELEYTT